jgi:flagellar protein FliT
MVDPYVELAELAQRQLAAVREGRPEDLGGLAAERAALIAGLPATPPASAADALRRALATEAQLADVLGAAHRDLGHRLARLRRGRQAVRAYGHVGVR